MNTPEYGDGGPAFPLFAEHDHPWGISHGMSLRAYIAAKMLPVCAEDHGTESAAKLAVEYADALIAKLNEPKETQ